MLSCGEVDTSEVFCLQTLKSLLKHTHTHTHTHTQSKVTESGVSEIELYCKLDTLQQNSSSVNHFHFISAINHTTVKLLPVLQHMG